MDLNCWNCLISGNRLNTAVTLREGTAYCEPCAREVGEQQYASNEERVQRMDDLLANIEQREQRMGRPTL